MGRSPLPSPAFPLLLALFVAAAASPVASAADFSALSRTSFEDAKGGILRVDSATTVVGEEPRRGTLVLFWASWCQPCKFELKSIAAAPDPWRAYRVVAISADETPQKGEAAAFLESITWPFERGYDPEGKYLFSAEPDGDLPKAVFLDARGTPLGVFNSVSVDLLPRLETLAKSRGAETPFAVENRFQFKSLHDPLGPDAEVLANTFAVQYRREDWTARAEGNSIRQRRPGESGFQRWENEVGRSYLQYGGLGADRRSTATLGDQSIHVQNGMILSLRPMAASDQNSSLLGLGWTRASESGLRMHLFGGKIRDQLFGFQLDPRNDLTIASPGEASLGASVEVPLSARWSASAAVARYHRDDDLALGYPAEWNDTRGGATLAYRSSAFGARVLPNLYYDHERARGNFGGAAGVDWTPGESANMALNAQIVRQDMPRVYYSILSEEPALPLSVDRKRVVSLVPMLKAGGFALVPRGIGEWGDDGNQGDRQRTAQLSLLDPDSRLKATFARQWRDLLTTQDRSRESFLETSYRVLPPLTVSAAYKRHSTGAESMEGQLSAEFAGLLQRWTGLRKWEVFNLTYVLAYQTGAYYFGYSGLSENHLPALIGRAKYGSQSLEVSRGRQSGGLKCSAGLCAQIPPLDGWRVVLENSISF